MLFPVSHWGGGFPRLRASQADFLYDLTEASGTRYDRSPNSLDLTDNNTVGQGTGLLGNCADFELSSAEYLNRVANVKQCLNAAAHSWTMWFKPESIPGQVNLAGVHASGGNSQEDWLLYIDGTSHNFGGIIFSASAGYTLLEASTFGALSTGTWYFLHCRYAAAGNLEVGVNGTWNSTPLTVTPGTTKSRPLYVGRREYSGAEGYADGLMEQFTKWPFSITNAEVGHLHNSGAARVIPD